MSFLLPLNNLKGADSPANADLVVFGGTFDPVHQGHISVLRSLVEVFSLVVVAPATSNPWKKHPPVSIQHRVEMIRLVCQAEQLPLAEAGARKGILVDDRGYTYSRDFVQLMRSEHDGKVYWAVGEDIASTVSSWKGWDELGVPVVVAPVTLAIHATEIREKTQSIHPAITQYCHEHSLYQSP